MRARVLGQEGGSLSVRQGSVLSRPVAAFLYLLSFVILLAASVLSTLRAHADRENLKTGGARWIWYSADLAGPRPLRFFATRNFLLERLPARATAKLFVDRSHVLYLNGARVGEGKQQPGDPLALYEVSSYLRLGVNRVAIEAASPTGIGGILFSLDLAGAGRDAVVSDVRWRVDLSPAAIGGGGRYRAMVWGRPPMHPWGYPRLPRPSELSGYGAASEETRASTASRAAAQ